MDETMKFVFEGTLDEIKETIRTGAEAAGREIVLYQNQEEPTTLKIGFLRLGKKVGRYFVANVSEENGRTTLDGEIRRLPIGMPSADTRSKPKRILIRLPELIFSSIFLYLFLALIPWVTWSAFDLPRQWISFLIPAAALWLLKLLPQWIKGDKLFSEADEAFLRFLSRVVRGEVTSPADTQELYAMLMNTDGLHSFPKLKGDLLVWELYEKVRVEAYVEEGDTMINIICRGFLRGFSTHWHPALEDLYDELCKFGREGNILVLRKSVFGTEAYYIGKPEGYRFSPDKKRHWGKLIYLTQKKE